MMEDEKINQPMTELAGEAAKAERAGGLLESRDYYKPFQYPWAYEAFMQSEQMHWLWTEVPMLEDVKDYQQKAHGFGTRLPHENFAVLHTGRH